jgi:hypothetical protein
MSKTDYPVRAITDYGEIEANRYCVQEEDDAGTVRSIHSAQTIPHSNVSDFAMEEQQRSQLRTHVNQLLALLGPLVVEHFLTSGTLVATVRGDLTARGHNISLLTDDEIIGLAQQYIQQQEQQQEEQQQPQQQPQQGPPPRDVTMRNDSSRSLDVSLLSDPSLNGSIGTFEASEDGTDAAASGDGSSTAAVAAAPEDQSQADNNSGSTGEAALDAANAIVPYLGDGFSVDNLEPIPVHAPAPIGNIVADDDDDDDGGSCSGGDNDGDDGNDDENNDGDEGFGDQKPAAKRQKR